MSQTASKPSQPGRVGTSSTAPLVGNPMRHLVMSVLAVVPLADALDVFAEFVQGSNESAAMLAVATLRGEETKPLIESRSGPSNSTDEAGERLGKTAETVRNWIEQGRLIAYRAIGDRTRIRLPLWQFDDEHGVRPWVSSLISAYGENGWSLLDFVTVPRSSLGGAPFLHRLLGGHESDIAEVIAAARRTNPT